MQVKLAKNDRGLWQADVVLPDGRDFHGVGNEPGDALVQLGLFWLEQPKENDLATLGRVMVERRDG